MTKVIVPRHDLAENVPQQAIKSMRQTLYVLEIVVVLALVGMFALYADHQNAAAREKSRVRTLAAIIAANTTQFLQQKKEVTREASAAARFDDLYLNEADDAAR